MCTQDVGSLPAVVLNGVNIERLSLANNVTQNDVKSDAKLTTSSAKSAVSGRRGTSYGLLQSHTGTSKISPQAQPNNDMEQNPNIRYENTYKTEPDSGKKLCLRRVKQLANEVLERELEGESYCPNTAGRLACNAANVIKNEAAMKKEGSDLNKGDKDGVFAEWQKQKQSIVQPPAGAQLSSRRKSNLKDLATHLNMTRNTGTGFRRLTLSMRAKSEISADNFGQSKVKKENTYKMSPDENIKISCPKVKNAVEKLLQDELGDFGYELDFASKLACDLSDKIKDAVKELGFHRHKIAVNVMVGQAADQGGIQFISLIE
ncbi:DYT2B-like protein [Mya arenaria]|uniref:DYT2B-like protein n=1 Tax=Mya arenaria TaxID=6604 RepID=A0ABY7DU16_MYAAR|nr:DYT2B-like protein [Mya arenaria]